MDHEEKSSEVAEMSADKTSEAPASDTSGDAAPQVEAAAAAERLPYESLEQQLAEAQKKVDEQFDQLLRTKAEVENLRRRHERELENAHKFALDRFVQDLFPVVDSMELGLAASSDEGVDVARLREGGELTLKQLLGVLDKFGITPLDPLKEKFNPERHQAMTTQESSEVEPNTVLAVIQKGYLLNDRLVRPALVMVSRQPQQTSDTTVDETA